jgi:hypothetical protein
MSETGNAAIPNHDAFVLEACRKLARVLGVFPIIPDPDGVYGADYIEKDRPTAKYRLLPADALEVWVRQHLRDNYPTGEGPRLEDALFNAGQSVSIRLQGRRGISAELFDEENMQEYFIIWVEAGILLPHGAPFGNKAAETWAPTPDFNRP